MMAKASGEIITDLFPGEITTQILANLPVKSLLRLCVVCKEWRNTITEPEFITLQLNKSIKSDSHSTFIFIPRLKNEQTPIRNPISSYSLVDQNLHNPLLFKTTYFDFKLRLLKNKGRILGISCIHGLICISCFDFDYERIYTHIFNPATQDSAELPDITAPPGVSENSILTCTLCFDCATGRYKVVVFFDWGRRGSEAHVFTLGLGSNSWRKLEDVPRVALCATSSALVNGSVYWLGVDSVLTFNLVSEKFGSIPNPPSTSSFDCRRILNLGGCLSVVYFPRGCVDCIELWVMMDCSATGSWTKFMIKTRPDCLHGKVFDSVVPMSFKKENGEILFLFGTNIVSYNAHTEEYTLHKVLHRKAQGLLPTSKFIYDVYPYIGNLAPVKSLV